MDIEHFREFVAIGGSPSIQSAARKLFMAPSTLSKHLLQMEEEVGLPLAIRDASSMKLTAAGTRFLENAIAIVTLYDECTNDFALREDLHNVVTIGGNLREPAIQRLVTNTAAYVISHREPISIMPHNQDYDSMLQGIVKDDPRQALENEQVDVSILLAPEKPQLERFESVLLFKEPLCAMIPADNKLAQSAKPLGIADLKWATFITTSASPSLEQRVYELGQAVGIAVRTHRKPFFTLEDMLVCRNDHEAFVVTKSTAMQTLPPSLTGLAAVDLNATIEVRAYWSPANPNPAIPLFLELLSKMMALDDIRNP